MKKIIPVAIRKVGDKYLVYNVEYGLSAIGKTVKEALLNFQKVFEEVSKSDKFKKMLIEIEGRKYPLEYSPDDIKLRKNETENHN